MNTPPAHPLDYAPPLPWHARRRWRRRIVLAAVLLSLALSFPWLRAGWHNLQLMLAYRQCAKWTMPPDQLVYTEDPAIVGTLTAQPEYVRYGGPSIWPPVTALHVPRSWATMQAVLGSPGPKSYAVLFLHELTSPSGARRLVVVTCDPAEDPAFDGLGALQVSVVVPGTPFRPATFHPQPRLPGFTQDYDGPSPSIHFYAGQCDPADASHFSVRYSWGWPQTLTPGASTGQLDGWLDDDPQSPSGVHVCIWDNGLSMATWAQRGTTPTSRTRHHP